MPPTAAMTNKSNKIKWVEKGKKGGGGGILHKQDTYNKNIHGIVY